MLSIGDIHIYVSDFEAAVRFWAEGLRLEIAEQERTGSAAYARLEFPDGGPAILLFGQAQPWERGARPPTGIHPTIRFDVTTTEFDEALVRLLDNGGQQLGEIERYEDLRMVTLADPDENSFDLIELPADMGE